MSNDLNRCEFIGRLGADPEIRAIASGKQVANFRIACGEQWKDAAGQKQERTEWVQIVAWGKLAEIIGQYLRKGSRVYVAGKLTTRKWQGNDGQDRYTTEVVIDQRGTMQMLDGKPVSAQAPAGPTAQAAPIPRGSPADQSQHGGKGSGMDPDNPQDFDDEIPF